MGYAQKSSNRDLRRDVRYPTSFAARIGFSNTLASVTVGDISSHGCRLKGDTLPDVGQSVLLRSAGLEVAGLVMWREGSHAGISFRRRIEPLAVVRDNLSRFREMREQLGKPVPAPVV